MLSNPRLPPVAFGRSHKKPARGGSFLDGVPKGLQPLASGSPGGRLHGRLASSLSLSWSTFSPILPGYGERFPHGKPRYLRGPKLTCGRSTVKYRILDIKTQAAWALKDYVMPTPARFDLKLDKDDKELFAEAASLMGTSMAGFVRAAAKEKARSVIDQESRLTLTRQDFRVFSAALEQAFSPNEALQEALDSARQTVRRA